MAKKRVALRWALVILGLGCVVALVLVLVLVVANRDTVSFGAQEHQLRVYIMDHREEIEADMREVYDEWKENYDTFEKYKDSEDEEEFDRAVDAWNMLVFGIYDVYSSWYDKRVGMYVDAKLRLVTAWAEEHDAYTYDEGYDTANRFHAIPENPEQYRTVFTDRSLAKLVDEVFWGGEVALTDLPKNIPTDVGGRNKVFPKYEGSARNIEDDAMPFYRALDYGIESENLSLYLVVVQEYADYVTKHNEVLERRGFFAEHPSGSETCFYAASGRAKYLYGRAAGSMSRLMEYNEFVRQHNDVLEEGGFFEEYPVEIKIPSGKADEDCEGDSAEET